MPKSRTKPAPRGSDVPNIAPNDLPRLMKWLYVVDRGFLGDALWLRYEGLKRQARHSHLILQKYACGLDETSCKVRCEQPPHILISSKAPPCGTKDYLTILPPDLRLAILEFLLKPLPLPPRPKIMLDLEECEEMGYEEDTSYHYAFPRPRPSHPLNQLAATSKTWRDQVEGFCDHQLLVLKQQVVLGRQDNWVPWRQLRVYTTCARMELVVRLSECCAFCGMETVSQSEKWPGLTVCGPCEDP
jgi:hypothetical protein